MFGAVVVGRMLACQWVQAPDNDSLQIHIGQLLSGDLIHGFRHAVDLDETRPGVGWRLRLRGQRIELRSDQALLGRQLQSLLLVELRPCEKTIFVRHTGHNTPCV